jgi:magnesium transporter
MQILEITGGTLRFLEAVPAQAPSSGFVWIYLERDALATQLPLLQEAAQRLGGSPLLDLHVKDLANPAHPSHYDYTSVYDLVVFRRLAAPPEVDADLQSTPDAAHPLAASTLSSFQRIRTRAVGFAVFDRLLITVHPMGCDDARVFIDRVLAEAVHNEAWQRSRAAGCPTAPLTSCCA